MGGMQREAEVQDAPEVWGCGLGPLWSGPELGRQPPVSLRKGRGGACLPRPPRGSLL